MSYLVLARKYRPQQFEDLVGQIPVSQTLLNAIESGRIAHAYIFSGPRGVGKTTTARLLAKCLNCEKGPTGKPCNTCASCVSIAQGTSVQDVLEIDGASNRGIEQIRELRDSAKYMPASSRYRIYIIDEAHQITKDAFGALLKTLEEPPAHVIFMMATTEVQKIPAPILSRCQRFSLRPISPDLVLKHLQDISAKEKVKVDEAALADIVRFVEGSLRDALSLLDQAIVFSPEGITPDTLRQLLGFLPRDVIRQAVSLIAEGDPARLLRFISSSVVENGIDLTQLAKDLQDHYHTLLLAKAGVKDFFEADRARLEADLAQFDFPLLERNIRLLSRALDEMRRSETPRAIFEIYALKMAQKLLDPKTLLEKLERLSKSAPAVTSVPPKPAATPPGPSAPSRPAAVFKAETKPAPAPVKETSIRTAAPAAEPPVQRTESNLTQESVDAAWPSVVSAVTEQKMTLGSALEDAGVSVQNGALILMFDSAFTQQLVNRSLSLLQPIFNQFLGGAVAVDTRVNPNRPPASKKAAPEPAPRPATSGSPEEKEVSLEEIPADQAEEEIRRVLKYFPGNLKQERKSE